MYKELEGYDMSWLPNDYWDFRPDFGDLLPDEVDKAEEVCYNGDIEEILTKEKT